MGSSRFYDKDPVIRQALDVLFRFPTDIQTIVAGGITLIAERDFAAQEVERSLKSLGSDRVMALHMSQKKQRGYDANPALHRAINYLMIMTVENQHFICRKIMELTAFIRDYLDLCGQAGEDVNLETVETISGKYVEYGPDEAKAFMDTVHAEFMRRLNLDTGAPQVHEEIENGQSGMRIREL